MPSHAFNNDDVYVMVTEDVVDSGYVIDTESAEEMARLIQQDRLLTRAMNQLIPPELVLSKTSRVLDIACGPGGWVTDVAHRYPKVEATGIDISRTMLDYARTMAKANGLQNAYFQLMDVRDGLDFPDASFDFVNARFLAAFMKPDGWPSLVQECKRVTKPGGVIRLTEAESPITNSAAFEQLNRFSLHALKSAGQSFSSDGYTACIAPVISALLRDVGLVEVVSQGHAIEFSSGTEENRIMTQNLVAALKLVRPFVVRWKQTTPEEADALYQEAVADFYADTFRGVWFYLSSWGKKPV